MKKIINPWEGLDGYMCFGCAPNNPLGLHMEFFEDGDDIVAGWVVLRKLQTSGVTSRLDAKFMKSISTDEPQLTIRGRMTDRKRNAIFIETEIYNSANELCTRAEMVYFITPQERAMEEFGFCGCKTEDEH